METLARRNFDSVCLYALGGAIFVSARKRSWTQEAAANGQFLLIRRDAYDGVGGHEAVRARVLEDVALARLVKSSGRNIFFAPGQGIVRTRMYRTFGAMWQGWTKNLYRADGWNAGRVRARDC